MRCAPTDHAAFVPHNETTMATLTLSQELFDADFAGLIAPSEAISNARLVFIEAGDLLSFDDPITAPTSISSTRTQWTNPEFAGFSGTYRFTGSLTETVGSDGVRARTWSVTGLVVDGLVVGGTTGRFTATVTSTVTATSGSASTTKGVFVGADGTGFEATGTISSSATLTSSSYTEEYTGLTLSSGNTSIKLTGKIAFDSTGAASGTISAIEARIAGKTISATGLALSADAIIELDLSAGFAGIAESFLGGNDNITLSATSPVSGPVEAFGGNDTITGSTSDDIIDGGAGNDSINAGTG
ncbi:MAG: hypothetical protein EBS23_07890, partial [Betaproteobacteria bacterium]|nr:hypothetical protein [Betaproteobacteria bacterium]